MDISDRDRSIPERPGDDTTSATGSEPPAGLAGAARLGALSALLLSDLRAGRSPTSATLNALGLSNTHPYAVVVVEADAAGDLGARLAQSGAHAELPVVHAVIERWLFALVPGPVEPGDRPTAVAQSSRQTLADAASAFKEAEHALATAQAFGVTGLVDLQQLTPLAIVTATTSLAASASKTTFARLDALGPAGAEIETAVAALLAHDQNIDQTAAGAPKDGPRVSFPAA